MCRHDTIEQIPVTGYNGTYFMSVGGGEGKRPSKPVIEYWKGIYERRVIDEVSKGLENGKISPAEARELLCAEKYRLLAKQWDWEFNFEKSWR
jgi:hypothetical protein